MRNKSKAQCYADGGLVKQLHASVNRLVGNNPKALEQRGRDPDAVDPPKPQAGPGYNSGVKTKENPAGIRFAKGGKVHGKGGPTSDTVPAMLSPGEFVLKAKAVSKIGVPALEALNKIADKSGARKRLSPAAAASRQMLRMADGGLVDDPRRVAPYVNHRAPSGPPAMPPPLALPNNMPPPGSAVAVAPQAPNFTMPPGNQPPPAQPAYTDVRTKWNPANASNEAKAWMDDRAPKPVAAPGAAPAQSPAPTGPTTAQSAKAMLSNGVSAARSAVNTPLVKGIGGAGGVAGALTAIDTPTEAYRERFGIGPNEGDSPYSMAARDLGVRALGAASDVGNAMLFGLPGLFYRDKQNPQAAAMTPPQAPTPPVSPVSPVAPANAGAAVSPVSPVPVAPPPSTVTRVGNSYSGPANIEGDITINGRAPRGGVSVVPGAPGGGMAQSASDQALQAARMAAIQRGDVESVRASFGGDFGPKVDPLQALMNNGRPMTTKKAAAAADLLRAGGDPTARAESAAKTDLTKVETQAARQLLKAQENLTKAKTPAEQAKALDTLRALTGKYEKELPNRFTVVPGGQEIGPNGLPITRPARVINNQTGVFVDQPESAKPAASYETGRVYQDGRGNKAKWDGTKFVPA